MRDQISTIVATAEFNSTNLIASGATNTSVLSTVDGSVIAVSAQSMDTSTLGIASVDLTTSAGATTALTAIDSAITSVSDKLATLGSAANRKEAAPYISKGTVASYIPTLEQVPADRFGIALAAIDGGTARLRDARIPLSIQSISKVFTLMLAIR